MSDATFAPPEWAAPLEVPVELGSASITVRPASVGQIMRMIAVGAPVVDALMALSPELVQRLQRPELLDAADMAEMFDLFGKHPAKLAELLAAATGVRVDEVQALLPDRFAYLFAVVVAVNADFFSRATPVFAAAGRVLQQIRPAQGVDDSTPGNAPSTA